MSHFEIDPAYCPGNIVVCCRGLLPLLLSLSPFLSLFFSFSYFLLTHQERERERDEERGVNLYHFLCKIALVFVSWSSLLGLWLSSFLIRFFLWNSFYSPFEQKDKVRGAKSKKEREREIEEREGRRERERRNWGTENAINWMENSRCWSQNYLSPFKAMIHSLLSHPRHLTLSLSPFTLSLSLHSLSFFLLYSEDVVNEILEGKKSYTSPVQLVTIGWTIYFVLLITHLLSSFLFTKIDTILISFLVHFYPFWFFYFINFSRERESFLSLSLYLSQRILSNTFHRKYRSQLDPENCSTVVSSDSFSWIETAIEWI